MRKLDWRALLRYESGSVLMIVFGLLLTLRPDYASGMVSAMVGWVLIGLGVAAMVLGILGKTGMESVVSGVVLLLVGKWLHGNPLMIASAMGILLGILALSQGWRELKNTGVTRRNGGFWIVGAVLAIVEILTGIRLILSPLLASRLVLRVGGVVMVICGLGNLSTFSRSRKYLNDSKIIDAE